MKASEIQVGDWYYDGKQGLREVIAETNHGQSKITYVVHSAKVIREGVWNGREMEYKSVLGVSSTVNFGSFLNWAKVRLTAEEGRALSLELEAGRAKLSAGEKAFMAGVFKEAGALTEGASVSFDHTEGRATSGLAKKGLLKKDESSSGEVEITALGAGYLRVLAQSAQPAASAVA